MHDVAKWANHLRDRFDRDSIGPFRDFFKMNESAATDKLFPIKRPSGYFA